MGQLSHDQTKIYKLFWLVLNKVEDIWWGGDPAEVILRPKMEAARARQQQQVIIQL